MVSSTLPCSVHFNLVFPIQALYFKEQDIDEFRDCFYLKTKPNSGHITSVDELKTIMRSLGMSPTQTELEQYFKEKSNLHSQYLHRIA